MNTLVESLARALVEARRQHGTLASQDWHDALPDSAAAYTVQHLVANAFGWCPGGTAKHWKSGGPSRDTPLTHAPLAPEGVFGSPGDLSAWPLRMRIVEAEVALRLGEDVSPETALSLTPASAEARVDAMCVSLEIAESRWRDFEQATPLMKLADSQSHGALVLGDWTPYRRRDWSEQRCELRIGEQAPIVRIGSHPLGDPSWLLTTWLRHATRGGATLSAGTIVTTGSWVGMPFAQAGDEVTAEFEGIGHARVRL